MGTIVEVDWMGAEGPWPWQCKGDGLVGKARQTLTKFFVRYDIELQIWVDQEVPRKEKISFQEITNNYYNNPDYFTPSRKGVFRYCFMAHKREGNGALGEGLVRSDRFVLYNNEIYWSSLAVWLSSAQICVFMHELGHNINMYDDDDTDGDGILDRYHWLTGEDDEDGYGNDVPDDGDNRNEDDDDDHTFEDYCSNSSCAMARVSLFSFPWGYCAHHLSQIDMTW